MSKQRNLRRKRTSEEQEDEDDAPEIQKEVLAGLKLLQKQRKRVAGVDASKLVPAAAQDEEEDAEAENEVMNAQYVKAEGTAKSQIFDEEAHMQQFVERELAKRLGKSVDGSELNLSKQEREELELYKLPDGFQVKLTQDVSLPGMMTAITEVEVSKESKMRKIEETERVKATLLAKKTGQRAEGDGSGADGMKVRRGMFAFNFGKQQKRQLDIDPAELQEKRKYITDRTRDPKDLARMHKRR
jgi:ribosomal protein S6E (S10)